MSALDVKVQATRTDDVLRFMFSAAFGVAMVKSDGADDDYQTGYHAYEGWLLIPPPFSLCSGRVLRAKDDGVSYTVYIYTYIYIYKHTVVCIYIYIYIHLFR